MCREENVVDLRSCAAMPERAEQSALSSEPNAAKRASASFVSEPVEQLLPSIAPESAEQRSPSIASDSAKQPFSSAARMLAALEPVALLGVLAALVLAAVFQIDQTALLSMLVVLLALGISFARFEVSRPALRQLMPTVVLSSLAAAGRVLFAAIPDVKPVSAIAIISGVVFGRQTGFMVGALAALVSNMFFGQGPWTPWQMYAWGMVGYFAGVLADAGVFQKRWRLYAYGFVAPLFYGGLLNAYYIVGYVHPITWPSVVAAYAAGIPFDLVHAVATVMFLGILYQPWHRKLARIKTKFDL